MGSSPPAAAGSAVPQVPRKTPMTRIRNAFFISPLLSRVLHRPNEDGVGPLRLKDKSLGGRAAHVDVIDLEAVGRADEAGAEGRPVDFPEKPEAGHGDDRGGAHGRRPSPARARRVRRGLPGPGSPAPLGGGPPPTGRT